jgi:hypothetical protein
MSPLDEVLCACIIAASSRGTGIGGIFGMSGGDKLTVFEDETDGIGLEEWGIAREGEVLFVRCRQEADEEGENSYLSKFV